jgi:serine/threonine-protein kinase
MLEEMKPIDRDERLNRVLAEYLDAADSDNGADPAVWLDRYPEFRVELQEFFALRGRIESLTAPLRDDPTHDQPAPVMLGGYELLGEIGHGGMGVVYQARQIGAGRLVALKMIRAGQFATPTERARFRAEAEAAARLDHPRIVPVHEVGEIDGHPFYTMKLMSGGDLRGHLGRLRDGPAEAARLIAALARAVHHAHQHGILHRDLKPSNVLLDGNGNPHVADFGLARRLGEGSGLTASGDMLGTIAYMSPEQALGRSALVTTAADVYGLGAVLYACLTGRPPFDDSVPLVALDHLRSRDPQPPDRENPRVPRDLAAICLKCLEKEPHRRYASAGEMADDLERFLAGRPTHARPIGAVRRAVRTVRRRPGTATPSPPRSWRSAS